MVIDDYIPTDNGRPIFVSPVRENEVYPMLLEKAIAKVCGSYEEIPESAEEIMEMIFCGPVQTKKVLELREKELLGQTLQGCIRKKELAVLVSKRDPKIRNYGLNENEVYRVVRHRGCRSTITRPMWRARRKKSTNW